MQIVSSNSFHLGIFFFGIKFCFLLIQQLPDISRARGAVLKGVKCGDRSTSFEVKLGEGGGGCGVVDFKNGLPDADSKFFNTVAPHQSFFK